MSELDSLRDGIDAIDSELIPLFERRMELVRAVAEYKNTRGMAVLQPDREKQVIERAVARLSDRSYAPEAEQLMRAIMAVSRASEQRDIDASAAAPLPPCPRTSGQQSGAVGYYGMAGSFSEEAMLEYFGERRERVSCAEFEDVFAALKAEKIDYGVLPIENSSTGGITRVYDLLGSYGFFIVGECSLGISQNLVGVAGTTVETIKTVYSHTQGIEQSGRFLSEHHGWELTPFHSTSLSAMEVAKRGDSSLAAIASRRAAELYGLRVIVPDIQDRSENRTRFIVIGRQLETADADKVSVVFSLNHEAGSLYAALRCFAQSGVNMVKIESRPIPESLWNYLFYVDFEGDIKSEKVSSALEELERGARMFRILGAYRADKSAG